MEKKRRTKKKLSLPLKKKLTVVLTCVLVAVIGIMFILDKTGVYTFNQLQIDLNLVDAPASNAELSVHFIDVGQGDCTLIECDGKTMLIDSGEADSDNTVIEYLKSQDITQLDVIIVTHPHSDHMGEMSDIIDSFDVEKFIMPKVPEDMTPTSKIYENMLKSIKNKGLKITMATTSEFSFGKAEINLYAPDGDYSNLNNYSTLVKITHGENTFLITGDCETQEEKEMLDKGFDLSAKVLKVGHHGSSTSSSSDFLNVILPRYAVISCGAGNKYGHPNEETVIRLKKYADKVYITTESGNIVFESDGNGLSVKTQKE